MAILFSVARATWDLLEDASVYILLGLIIGGLLKMFLSPSSVAQHLGTGRVWPVFKAALIGIPLPLCSCGVLPAAASLRKQGANRGATTAFLIATPESGVDSIAITYALLDPILTLARPISAFVSAFGAGIAQNFLHPEEPNTTANPDLSCPVDRCCDGNNCEPSAHRSHHSLRERFRKGLSYAFNDLWGDLAGWFWVGMLLAGAITALVPTELIPTHLGGGLTAMLIMLVVGIPLYICATASTPVAAALILKGVSPGAALVFLLVGPATNITSLTVLVKVLGRRGSAIYLASIALFSVAAGLIVDAIYFALGIQAAAVVGESSELIPHSIRWVGAIILIALSIRPIAQWVKSKCVKSKLTSKTELAHNGCCGDSCAPESEQARDSKEHKHDHAPKPVPKSAHTHLAIKSSCGCGNTSCGSTVQLRPSERPEPASSR